MEENKQSWRIFKGSGEEREKLNEVIKIGRITGEIRPEEGLDDYGRRERSDLKKLQGETPEEMLAEKTVEDAIIENLALQKKIQEKRDEKNALEKKIKEIEEYQKKQADVFKMNSELAEMTEKIEEESNPDSKAETRKQFDKKEEEFNSSIEELQGLSYTDLEFEKQKAETSLFLAEKQLKELKSKIKPAGAN